MTVILHTSCFIFWDHLHLMTGHLCFEQAELKVLARWTPLKENNPVATSKLKTQIFLSRIFFSDNYFFFLTLNSHKS